MIDEARELARQRLEYGVDIRRRNARRKRIDQGIVGREPARLPEQRRLVAHQVHHLFQVRREQFEVIGLSGFDPEDFGARGGFGQACDQRGGVAMA